MTIIIGLGNPGQKFEDTRHNVGFAALDKFARENNFPEFELAKKYDALVSESGDVILAKPQTFMNESGKSARKLTENKNIENIIVVHDDIDLAVGKIKISKERGSAGHKGVESIIESIGNKDLIRIRIGIAPEEKVEAKNIVLKKFTEPEQELINQAVQKTCKALDLLLTQGLEKSMNEYNQ